MEPAMELTQVKKHYLMGDTVIRALDGITLSIQEGEFLSVVGQSGSGKSTLMNILGCLDLPDQGEFRLWGRRVDRCSEEELARIRNRTIGFVFQGFHLLPTLTAQENVELPLFYQGVPGSQRRTLAKQALERVELGQRLDHRPNQLSRRPAAAGGHCSGYGNQSSGSVGGRAHRKSGSGLQQGNPFPAAAVPSGRTDAGADYPRP